MRLQQFILVSMLGLVGCSSIEIPELNQGRVLGQQQQLNINVWTINGRLSIKSDEVLTANIYWKHDWLKDQLKLYGALGLGAVLINIDGEEISLDAGDGELQHSKDVDGFIARQLGFIVPITALRCWIKGDYLEGVPEQKLENGFLQLGWRVAYQEYMETSAGLMPRRIKITKQSMVLKLVIDQWEIQ